MTTTRAHEVLTQQQYEDIWQLVIKCRTTTRKHADAHATGATAVWQVKLRDDDEAAVKELARYLVRLTKFDDDETPAQ